MSLRIKISARAASQVRKAAEWWAQNRPAASGAIRADFGEAVALLAEQPGMGAKYEGARTPWAQGLLVLAGLFAFDDYERLLPLPEGKLDYSGPWTAWRGAVER